MPDPNKKITDPINTGVEPTATDSIAKYFVDNKLANTKIPLLGGKNWGANTPLEWMEHKHPNKYENVVDSAKNVKATMTDEDLQNAMERAGLKGTSDVLGEIGLNRSDLPGLLQVLLPKKHGGRTQVSKNSTYKTGGNVPGMFNDIIK